MTTQGIAIDLQAVTDLFSKLSADVDAGFAPDGERAVLGVGCGARFGAGFEGLRGTSEVQAGAAAFAGASSRYTSNVLQHIANARGLLAKVEEVLRRYRSADAVAAALTSSAMTRTGEYADESTSASAATVSGGVETTLPPPPLPRPPEFSSQSIAWGTAYDVQRMHNILRREDLDEAWSQVGALRLLGQTLEGHYRRVLELRPKLAESWPAGGSVTAGDAQRQLDEHAKAVWQDAVCAQTTAKSLDGIVSAISQAREKMTPLYDRWRSVTKDFVPEDFDHAAEQLNMQGRQVMQELDTTVADLRTQIYWPESATQLRSGPDDGKVISGSSTSSGSDSPSSSTANGSAGGGRLPAAGSVPPVPGFNPVEGPGLAGGWTPVGVSSSTPPSTLPIQPGALPGVPNGGAWVLPGPITGATGRLLPAPGRTTMGVTGSPGGAGGGAAGARGQSGMMGVPVGGYGGAAGSGAGASRQRMATEQWEVSHGVPPVIGEAGPFLEEEEEPQDEAGAAREEFEDWYNRVALPWNETLAR